MPRRNPYENKEYIFKQTAAQPPAYINNIDLITKQYEEHKKAINAAYQSQVAQVIAADEAKHAALVEHMRKQKKSFWGAIKSFVPGILATAVTGGFAPLGISGFGLTGLGNFMLGLGTSFGAAALLNPKDPWRAGVTSGLGWTVAYGLAPGASGAGNALTEALGASGLGGLGSGLALYVGKESGYINQGGSDLAAIQDMYDKIGRIKTTAAESERDAQLAMLDAEYAAAMKLHSDSNVPYGQTGSKAGARDALGEMYGNITGRVPTKHNVEYGQKQLPGDTKFSSYVSRRKSKKKSAIL